MIANFIFFQVLWFACVLGAAKEMMWPGIIVLLAFLFWQLRPNKRAVGDVALLLVAAIVGFVIDTLWVQIGLLRYETAYPIMSAAPLWIICLWVGFALTINHSLAWLKRKLGIAILLSMISAPASYFAGYRFGALEFLYDVPVALFVLALAWGAAFPLLIVLSKRLDRPMSPSVIGSNS